MSIMTVSEPITLNCGECGEGTYMVTAADTATCDTCADKGVSIARDIERYLEHGEFILATVGETLAYFYTETTDHEEN